MKIYPILLLLFLFILPAGCGGNGELKITHSEGISGDVSTGGLGAGGDTTAGIIAPVEILSWETPTRYSDGNKSEDGELQGYRIYCSTVPIDFNVWRTQWINGTYYFVAYPVTSFTINTLNLSPGTWYFVVTALDTTGMESDFLTAKRAVIN